MTLWLNEDFISEYFEGISPEDVEIIETEDDKMTTYEVQLSEFQLDDFQTKSLLDYLQGLNAECVIKPRDGELAVVISAPQNTYKPME